MSSYTDHYNKVKSSISGVSGGILPKNSSGKPSSEYAREATSSSEPS